MTNKIYGPNCGIHSSETEDKNTAKQNMFENQNTDQKQTKGTSAQDEHFGGVKDGKQTQDKKQSSQTMDRQDSAQKNAGNQQNQGFAASGKDNKNADSSFGRPESKDDRLTDRNQGNAGNKRGFEGKEDSSQKNASTQQNQGFSGSSKDNKNADSSFGRHEPKDDRLTDRDQGNTGNKTGFEGKDNSSQKNVSTQQNQGFSGSSKDNKNADSSFARHEPKDDRLTDRDQGNAGNKTGFEGKDASSQNDAQDFSQSKRDQTIDSYGRHHDRNGRFMDEGEEEGDGRRRSSKTTRARDGYAQSDKGTKQNQHSRSKRDETIDSYGRHHDKKGRFVGEDRY